MFVIFMLALLLLLLCLIFGPLHIAVGLLTVYLVNKSIDWMMGESA